MPTENFKLLGSEEAPVSSLGNMTQGLGFPLRPVEAFAPLDIITVEAIRAFSIVDQEPTGLGVALQVILGAPQTTDTWDLSAAGAVTCLVEDEYVVTVKFQVGRRGSSGGLAQIYARVLINGIQEGASVHVILDSPDFEIPAFFSGDRHFLVGDILTIEIVRDTDGADEGGLQAGNPSVAGWNDSPSVSLLLERTTVSSLVV